MSQQTQEEQRTLQGLEPSKELEEDEEPVADPEEDAARVVDETDDPDGASRTVSPTAPASAGKPVSDQGEVDPDHSPDLRPRDAEGARGPGPGDETPVPDPATSEATRTGSAGAASSLAGTGGAERHPGPNPRRGEDEVDEEKPEDQGE